MARLRPSPNPSLQSTYLQSPTRLAPPTSDPEPTLDQPRAYLYACALSRFHFIYGDFIRWMSGKYTNRHGQWTKDFQAMANSAARPLTPDYPVLDHPHAFRIYTEGFFHSRVTSRHQPPRFQQGIRRITTQQSTQTTPMSKPNSSRKRPSLFTFTFLVP